jgi:hypothetical protein
MSQTLRFFVLSLVLSTLAFGGITTGVRAEQHPSATPRRQRAPTPRHHST